MAPGIEGEPHRSTPSEIEISILRCLLMGMTHSQIAASLGIFEEEIKEHIGRALSKLQATDRGQLIIAIERVLSD